MSEEKIDKRSKEYRDSLKERTSVIDTIEAAKIKAPLEAGTSEVDSLKEEIRAMKEMMKTLGTIAKQNAEGIKKQDRAKSKAPGKAVKPRAAEMEVLKDFLDQFQGHLTYDKDLTGKIALNIHLRPSVEALNDIIQREPTLHKKAIELELYKNDNFKDIIIHNS
jgi:hypothetical protein